MEKPLPGQDPRPPRCPMILAMAKHAQLRGGWGQHVAYLAIGVALFAGQRAGLTLSAARTSTGHGRVESAERAG
jgi:hypothetical protein